VRLRAALLLFALACCESAVASESSDTSLVRLLNFTNAVAPGLPAPRASAEPSDARVHPYDRFAFLYEDETGNRIDTIEGTVTKDLGLRGDTTIALRLSDTELRQLHSGLLAIGYFDLPSTPSYWDPQRSGKSLRELHPYEPSERWIRITVRTDTTIHSVGWNGLYPFPVNRLSNDLLRLHNWINRVWALVVERPAYRSLPQRRVSASQL
jgi:hypothetical protein